jgi:hypothetical protein
MQTTYEPRNTSQELSERIKGHVEELANATDAARLSAVIQNYLKAASIFHQYSFNNILLINFAYPCATRVAGFQAWRKLNRWVRKGESGIPILAPILVKEKTEGEEGRSFLKGFKVVYVFDISQTDGDPLPEEPEWKSPERSVELQYRLMTFARKKGILVTVKRLAGDIQGVSKGGAIDIAPDAGTSTLLHELAHELLHRGTVPADRVPAREFGVPHSHAQFIVHARRGEFLQQPESARTSLQPARRADLLLRYDRKRRGDRLLARIFIG